MPTTQPRGGQILDATISLTADVTGTLPAGNGGTGAATLTLNGALLGNGTGALQTVAPGTAGNGLVSNGTTFTATPVLQASGTLKLTVATTAPASPATGDLWVDSN